MDRIKISESGDSVEITLYGELTIHNSDELLNSFVKQMEKHPAFIGINCRNLASIDSSGLGALISMARRSQETGSRLYVCELNSKVATLFDMSNLDKYFSLMPIEEFRQLSGR